MRLNDLCNPVIAYNKIHISLEIQQQFYSDDDFQKETNEWVRVERREYLR